MNYMHRKSKRNHSGKLSFCKGVWLVLDSVRACPVSRSKGSPEISAGPKCCLSVYWWFHHVTPSPQTFHWFKVLVIPSKAVNGLRPGFLNHHLMLGLSARSSGAGLLPPVPPLTRRSVGGNQREGLLCDSTSLWNQAAPSLPSSIPEGPEGRIVQAGFDNPLTRIGCSSDSLCNIKEWYTIFWNAT